MATLLAREDTHPALIDLLMQAADEVHGEPGVFQKPDEFPRAGHGEFPLSPEAGRYYKSGKPFLQRYLPFWAATLIDRTVVMLLPLVVVLFPLMRFAPLIYGWRVRSRIYRRYGELKFLENQVNENPGRRTRDEWLGETGRHRDGMPARSARRWHFHRHALHPARAYRPGAGDHCAPHVALSRRSASADFLFGCGGPTTAGLFAATRRADARSRLALRANLLHQRRGRALVDEGDGMHAAAPGRDFR
jgi:hypothetical protein